MSGESPSGDAGDPGGDLPPAQARQFVTDRLSDPEAYRLLIRLAETTRRHSRRCWSTAAATALAAAASVLRLLASGLYRANIGDKSKTEVPE